MPKVKSSNGRASLADEYSPTAVKQKAGKKRKQSRDLDEHENIIENKASRRILKFGQELAEEDELEQRKKQPNQAFAIESRLTEPASDDEAPIEDDEVSWEDEDEDNQAQDDVDPNDQDIFNKFLPAKVDPELDPNSLTFGGGKHPAGSEEANLGGGTNLADLILEKIAAHEATIGGAQFEPIEEREVQADEGDDDVEAEIELPPRVVEAYTTIGQILSRQKSGPLPKPFKVIPTLPLSQIPLLVSLTRPEDWSPYVILLSTRLFVSAKPMVVQPFLNNILLPRVRADIHEHKKIHPDIYRALKKSLYKPACFFKGLLFPLLEGHEGPCTLREAHIISSVVSKVSIPALHSAAALLRLCDMAAEQFSARQYGGGSSTSCTNVFIKCLIEKKYALPWKVVDALVFHFCRFKAIDPNAVMSNEDMDTAMTDGPGGAGSSSADKLPILWHQCLLAFAQRYRNDIADDQREELMELIQLRGHPAVGPEIRRELLEGRSRDAQDSNMSGIIGPSAGNEAGGMDAGAENIPHGLGNGTVGLSLKGAVGVLDGGDDTMVMG